MQFEPLIVAIIFPLSHVSSYTGPWAVKGTDLGEHFQRALQEGFKRHRAGSSPDESRVTESGSGGSKSPPEAYEEPLERIQDSPPLPWGTQDNYMSWMGHCLECSAIRKEGHGLFCGNYLLARGNYPPCRSVWCGLQGVPKQ